MCTTSRHTRDRTPACFRPLAAAFGVGFLAAAVATGPVAAVERSGSGAPQATAPCVLGGAALCLLDGRFELTASWENQHDGTSGTAMAVADSDFTGFFYFTDGANLELLVKMLDFGHEVKLFYGQLTNLRFELRVRDTATGAVRRYTNGPSECGAIDQDVAPGAVGAWVGKRGVRHAAGSCLPAADRLCLLDGRFAVSVDWRNHFNGDTGAATARPLSDLSGVFAYDDPRNVELVVKTLDFGNRFLFLYGALSDLEYTIRLTDTVTGLAKVYQNPGGRYCGGIDNDVLAPEEPEPTTGPLGPEGGLWVGLDGQVMVRVPAGALAESTQLTARRRTAAELRATIEPSLDVGSLLTLGPAGLHFALPATLRLGYDPGRLPPGLQPAQLAAAEQVGGEWLELPAATADGATRLAAGEIDGAGTYGVRRADAKAPCDGPEYRQFDFWLGRWSFDNFTSPTLGENVITRDEEGCYIFEDFRHGTYRGRSVTVYDPITGKLSHTYVDTEGNRWVLLGNREGRPMVLFIRPDERHIWDPVGPDEIRFYWERTPDGGRTWQLIFDSRYRRR